MQYDPKSKPNPNICPREFCFNWEERGWLTTRGIHGSREEALGASQSVEESGCGWELGRCHRWFSDSTVDFYEPYEPVLDVAGLPWFYFILTPSKLVTELRPLYVQESEALWGERHWEN
ncbi:hypothetical protein [Deinococcus aestuarii]|uniref:hypothetical protein n=1 Tax=Deinococcus aestuarii TaxID=2774531 RepID=UPI001C0C7590|nr:hypothetical protein [Deinococcus aestuarii]